MKAIVIRTYGGPEGLALVELPDPVPGAGQVLIGVEAVGVGGFDTLIRSGALAAYRATGTGHVPGSEVAGTVTAVGDGVEGAWLGRRVWGFTGIGGGCAEQAVVPVDELTLLPGDLSAADAVTVGGSGAVGHFGLAHARFAPGESVLVRGAGGGIGVMTVQLAARAGASAVAVTTSSPERGERLRELGATHVLDRSGTGDGSPDGYDVVVDIAAGDALPEFLDRLRPSGRMVVVGIMAGPPPVEFGARMLAAFERSLSFATFSMDSVPGADRRAVRAEQFAAASRGELRAVVQEVLPLQEAVSAHRKLAAGEVFGRLVLTP
ncbi:zinc-binding dehydrogenase [Streptomyces sp. NPDC087425]|uniref:zinc-binding dehydrogenase n=1 Tax=Streptomyces sp. NPDC087425 TaxID=3365787 RepID=UPI0038120540